VRKLPRTISPPSRNSQYENMFSRGNATSGEPICSGMIALAKPAKVGVANSSSMIVPCMVNAWLYCSVDRNCRPGRASSALIAIARTPPTRKKQNEVIRYRCPIFLWSVVVSQETITCPLPRRLVGTGVTVSVCVAIGVLEFRRSRMARSTTVRRPPTPWAWAAV
jgi:hypothetical protein